MLTVKRIHERKAAAVEAMQGLLTLCEKEDRVLTDEENGKFDELSKEVDGFNDQIEKIQRMRDLEAIAAERDGHGAERTGRTAGEMEKAIEDYDRAYRDVLRYGQPVTEEHRDILHRGLPHLTDEENQALRQEYRQQATTPGAVGGYLTSTEFVNRMTEFMTMFGGIETAAQVITTATGSQLEFPLMDTGGEEGEILAENVQAGEQDDQYDQRRFGAFKYTSRRVRISIELLQDSQVDIVGITAQRIGTRLGRINAKHVANGTGTGQPEGLSVAAPAGHTLAGAGVIGYNDIVDLAHSVDPAYRNDPSVRYVFHDTVLAAMRKIKSVDEVPLWQPGMVAGEPDRIFGYRYIVDQGMTPLGAGVGEKLAVFGALSYYLIRRTMGTMIFQQRESLIHFGQVGFIGFNRMDAGGLWSSTEEAGSPAAASIPVKALANP